MSLQDTIAARKVDIQTQLDKLDKQYAADRAVLQKHLALLDTASKTVTPEIQALLDGLGIVIPIDK